MAITIEAVLAIIYPTGIPVSDYVVLPKVLGFAERVVTHKAKFASLFSQKYEYTTAVQVNIASPDLSALASSAAVTGATGAAEKLEKEEGVDYKYDTPPLATKKQNRKPRAPSEGFTAKYKPAANRLVLESAEGRAAIASLKEALKTRLMGVKDLIEFTGKNRIQAHKMLDYIKCQPGVVVKNEFVDGTIKYRVIDDQAVGGGAVESPAAGIEVAGFLRGSEAAAELENESSDA